MNAAAAGEARVAFHHWGAGPACVMLIHGLGDGRFVWRGFESMLGQFCAGISIDLRGHGDSPRDPLQRYTAEGFVADVTSLLDWLDWPTTMLIGHSIGGEIAIQVAAARPARVHGVVAVDSGPELERTAAQRIRKDLRGLPRYYAAAAEFIDIVASRYPLADPTALRHYADGALRPHPNGAGFELKLDLAVLEGMPTPDVAANWSALESVACPMLLVRGRLSSVLSRHRALEVPRRVANCRLVEVDAAGHVVPLENPRGLYAAVDPFLRAVITPFAH